MARKDNSPAISFFSFQDIITSLTGIMFLIVLLLVILLFDMRPGVPDPATAEMQAKIAANAAELQTLRKAVKQTEGAVQQLKKLDLDTIIMRCSAARREEEKLRMQLAELQPEIAKDAAELQAVRRQNQELQQSLVRDQQTALQQRQTLLDLQKKRRNMEQKLQNRRRLARIAVENRTDLNPVLVECRREGIRILDFRSGKVTAFRPAGSSREELIRVLKSALDARDHSQEYYTLLVAPEAFAYATLTGADLGIREDRRGLEFYPDDRTTVFAEEQP